MLKGSSYHTKIQRKPTRYLVQTINTPAQSLASLVCLEGLSWWLQPLGYGFCDEPCNYIYDIEKLSLALSYVVEPEGLIFAKDIKIDGDAIFVKMIPSAMTQMSNNSQGIWGMRNDV